MKIKFTPEETQEMLKRFAHPHFTNTMMYVVNVEVDPEWVKEVLPAPLEPDEPVGGANMVPKLVHPGALIVGDAAMLCMNLGYMVRGMDLAIASGRFAAEAACDAIDAQDVTEAGLSSYMAKMEESFVMKDLKTFSAWPATMEHWDAMFTDSPKMVGEIFDSMFIVDGEPQAHLKKRIMPIVKKRGLFKLFGDVRRALKAL